MQEILLKMTKFLAFFCAIYLLTKINKYDMLVGWASMAPSRLPKLANYTRKFYSNLIVLNVSAFFPKINALFCIL